MKLLVLAFYAQFRVSAGRWDCGLPVTAYGSCPAFLGGFLLWAQALAARLQI